MHSVRAIMRADMKPYPYYRYYILRTLVALLLIPVYVGIAYYAYTLTGEGKVFLITLIACIVLSAVFAVVKDNCRKCPECNCHTLSTQTESAVIASFRLVTSRVFAVCRNCGYRRATDLAFKSNVMFHKLPVKVEEEE